MLLLKEFHSFHLISQLMLACLSPVFCLCAQETGALMDALFIGDHSCRLKNQKNNKDLI